MFGLHESRESVMSSRHKGRHNKYFKFRLTSETNAGFFRLCITLFSAPEPLKPITCFYHSPHKSLVPEPDLDQDPLEGASRGFYPFWCRMTKTRRENVAAELQIFKNLHWSSDTSWTLCQNFIRIDFSWEFETVEEQIFRSVWGKITLKIIFAQFSELRCWAGSAY